MSTVADLDGIALKYLNDDNRDRYIAQSILYGFVRDPLPDTPEEARDVIAWHQERGNG